MDECSTRVLSYISWHLILESTLSGFLLQLVFQVTLAIIITSSITKLVFRCISLHSKVHQGSITTWKFSVACPRMFFNKGQFPSLSVGQESFLTFYIHLLFLPIELVSRESLNIPNCFRPFSSSSFWRARLHKGCFLWIMPSWPYSWKIFNYYVFGQHEM